MNNVFLRHVTILFLNSYSVCAVKFFEVIVCDHVFVDVALNGFMLYLRIGYDADLFVVYFLVQCVVGFVWLDDFEKGCVLDQQAHAVLVALADVFDELWEFPLHLFKRHRLVLFVAVYITHSGVVEDPVGFDQVDYVSIKIRRWIWTSLSIGVWKDQREYGDQNCGYSGSVHCSWNFFVIEFPCKNM